MSLPSHLTYRHSPLLLHTLDNEDGSVLEAAPHDWPPDILLVRHSEMVIQQFILSHIIFDTFILDIKRREKQASRIRRFRLKLNFNFH